MSLSTLVTERPRAITQSTVNSSGSNSSGSATVFSTRTLTLNDTAVCAGVYKL